MVWEYFIFLKPHFLSSAGHSNIKTHNTTLYTVDRFFADTLFYQDNKKSIIYDIHLLLSNTIKIS